MEDASLMKQIAGGDEAALQALLRRYGPLIRYILRPILSDQRDREECYADISLKIWQTAGSYDYFVVERDGVAIARVTGSRYTDLTSIGTVRYRVRGCYAGSGNYGISDTQSVDVRPEWNMICELAAGEWLDLRLSETQTRANGRTHTAQITTVHLLGLAYPVAEAAEFRDLTLSVSCAFPRSDEDSARALEALVGRLVCLKTPEGSMATGYLAELQSEADEFMRRYAFSIENIHRQEAITLDA